MMGSASLQPTVCVLWVVVFLTLAVQPTHEEGQNTHLEEVRLKRSLANLEEHYSEEDLKNIFQPKSRQKRLIYWGTKWCGDGNEATGYDDLGSKRELDMCCREHDHCNMSISSNSTRYTLRNPDSHTRSHCDCDDVFRTCLRQAGGIDAGIVGNIYFGVTTCFRFDYPAKCTDRSSQTDRCIEYTSDRTLPKKWQFFDPLPWNYRPPTTTTIGKIALVVHQFSKVFQTPPPLPTTTDAPPAPTDAGKVTSRAASSLTVGSISTVSVLAFIATILICKKASDNDVFCRPGIKYQLLDTGGTGKEGKDTPGTTQDALRSPGEKSAQVQATGYPLTVPVDVV